MKNTGKNSAWVRRLRDRRGESIAETLIALLIAMVGLTMLAGMITAGARLITHSRTLIREYYGINSALETRPGTSSGETGSSGGDCEQDSIRMTLYRDVSGVLMKIESFDVRTYTNTTISSRPVTSYKQPEP